LQTILQTYGLVCVSDEGPYGFIFNSPFPRFLEVRSINDRIVLHVEAELLVKDLLLDYVRIWDEALYDEANALRIQNNLE